ncbi:two-component system, OmpR family, phosphate regulon sensor histidine kinase PhoR [Evansella caseinilytica]|uniref:histidine kinase n=1 Tax=Evansella caseinilytica TaxID=1503961 RepID=A0A1H3TW49_9BACI|nr:ATP-binding protein [Evansella caseinilytica]SDZ54332.1 two-component system, OmpR family, phosphate regulon sensor histidine kinase PhoR [Evansella caseinilytica]
MSSYRSRLIFPLALIVLFVLASLGAILGPVFKEFYLERLNDRVMKETDVVAAYLTEAENLSALRDRMNQLADLLDIRITMLDMEGAVLGDTDADPLAMDNHLHRPEIAAAVQSGTGQEIRYSITMEQTLLYYAVPFYQNDEQVGFLRLGMPVEQLTDIYQNIWMLLFVCFFVAFVIIVFFTSKLTNQIITPIEDARRVATQLARGNFSARTYEGLPGETGQLNESLNILAENLEQISRTYEVQQERLETLIENMGSGLILINAKGDITLVNRSCKDIFQEDTDLWLNKLYYQVIKHKDVIKLIQEILLTENRKRSQLALRMEIEIRHFDVNAAPIIGNDQQLKGVVLVFHDITELKKLEKTRRDFVANVSHELKTPVTSLKGFTETLLAGAMDDEELRKKFLTIIANESERLESLIYDLLELSKIEGEQFRLQLAETELEVIVDEVFMMLQKKASKKSISLRKKVSGTGRIEGDTHRLKQLLINLINNAIMYTPDGGEVTVRIKEQAETVVLEIQDTGIGISKKELPRIFERFYRVDRARSRNSGGTGLGLAIVKHIAEAQKARMTVDSEVGKGTTFRLAFYKEFPASNGEEANKPVSKQ